MRFPSRQHALVETRLNAAAPTTRFNVSAASLDRSIATIGRPASLDHLFSTLAAGEPITMGVFGASVAQNAGCLDQAQKRCMGYSGRGGRRKGWAVQFLEHINRSWPHAQHRINNSALDATPAGGAAGCLLSYFPRRAHLAIVEFGSMAIENSAKPHDMERVVRTLLGMPNPPLVLLLSFPMWCSRWPKGSPHHLFRLGEQLSRAEGHGLYPDYPWATVETESTRLCQHYEQACVSVHAGLRDQLVSGEIPLSAIVGEDCLHPIHGTQGPELVAQLLAHWLGHAADVWRQQPRRAAPRRGVARLPRPLYPEENARKQRPTRCYTFRTSLTGMQALSRVEWCSEQTPANGDNDACWRTPHATCPDKILSKAGADAEAAYTKFMASPPSGWFYCFTSLGRGTRKRSEGVAALVPGAMLRIRLAVADLGASTVAVQFSYLASYENMGTAELACVDACACATQRLDAHKTDAIGNTSVFLPHEFNASIRGATCELQLRVLDETRSGAHKFKVRDLQVQARDEQI